MPTDDNVRDALLSLIRQQKTLYLLLSTAVNEISALRETVRALDPTFGETLDRKRQEAAQANESVIRSDAALYDQLIRRLG